MDAAAEAGAAAAAPQAGAPFRSRLSISVPAPFLPYPGDPPLPWRAWHQVFSTYMCLLEEERGAVLSDRVKNSLLFGLLGTEGHKQFSGNPAIVTLQTATFTEFEKSIADHFRRPINTARAIWDLHHRTQGSTESAAEFLSGLRDIIPDCGYDAAGSKRELAHALLLGCRSETAQLEMLKLEPDLDVYFRILESDERSKADVHLFQSSAAASSSFTPVGATYNRQRGNSNFHTKGTANKAGAQNVPGQGAQ